MSSQSLSSCYTLPGSGCTGTWQGGTLSCGNVNPTVNAASVYACTGYRLPTEAEWEVAARAGTTTDTYGGELSSTSGNPTLSGGGQLGALAWILGSRTAARTDAVASAANPVRLPNAWGLYDMLGNVWEWTWDWRDWGAPWSADLGTNPAGPGTGSDRVMRGCSWAGDASGCRAAQRLSNGPGVRGSHIGFRPARSAGP